MELLDGESLADRIRRGQLPLADVLKYGQQVAFALDAAHRKGIVHRDLKPGNVMLTKSGAKLLDFGLARSASGVMSSRAPARGSPAWSGRRSLEGDPSSHAAGPPARSIVVSCAACFSG